MSKHPRLLVCGLLLLSGTAPAQEIDTWALCHAWPAPRLDYPLTATAEMAPILLGADAAEIADNDVFRLFGDIRLQRPDEQLRADQAIYYKSRNLFQASGNVHYDTPGFSTRSSAAEIDSTRQEGYFETADFTVYDRHARGSSGRIELHGRELTVLRQASYTTCDADDEAWALRASRIELNHASGMGDAYHTRVYFQDVPVFYFPFVRFPITNERMTGLLPPSFGSSDLGGYEFAQPLYLNLHPQLDATVTPHNYSNRGLKWDNELRYLSRYGEGEISTGTIDDAVYGGERSLFDYRHLGNFGPRWSSNVLFSRVSDDDYLDDFGTSLSITSTAHLERHAQLSYFDERQQLFMQVQDFQILDDSLAPAQLPFRRLPQIKHELTPLASGPIRFEMETEIVRFQRQQSIGGGRADLNPALSLPYRRTAGFVIPKLSLHQTYYELDDDFNTLNDTRLSRTTPVNSLDSGLYFERDSRIGDTAYLQTLEPRLFYLYVPYRDQSDYPLFDSAEPLFGSARLFSENRFSGIDRLGDTQQVTLALSSRLLNAEDGNEKLYGTIGKIVYLEDRRVGLNGNILDQRGQSDIVLEGQYNIDESLSLKANLLWNPDDELITMRDIRLQYMSDQRHIVNLRYRDRGNRISAPEQLLQELDASLLWPLTPRWSMMARRYHSLPDDRTLEKMAGFEYNSCCWAFRAVRRATFAEDANALSAPFGHLRYSWYMQLELKGLTSLGKRIDEFMQEQIVGFSAVN